MGWRRARRTARRCSRWARRTRTSSSSTRISRSRRSAGPSARCFPSGSSISGFRKRTWWGSRAGSRASGKIPFISSFAAFILCKGFDQLRMGAAYPKLNVKVAGSHGGISHRRGWRVAAERGGRRARVLAPRIHCVHPERRAHDARGGARGGRARWSGVSAARPAEDAHCARGGVCTSSSVARSRCAMDTT